MIIGPRFLVKALQAPQEIVRKAQLGEDHCESLAMMQSSAS